MGFVVVGLALAAALFYALSDFLEQRAAQRARQALIAGDAQGPDHRGPLGLLAAGAHRLIRDRLWITGWAAGTFAYLVQAAALQVGSVSVVQALQVTTLLYAIPLSTIGQPERPRLRDLLAAGGVCLGLGLFLFARGPGGHSAPDRGRILLILLVLAITVVVLCAAAWTQRGAAQAVLLAVAAGTAFASSATMVKLTTADLTDRGVLATARDWPGYAVAFLALLGLVLQQAAFAAGKLPTATTAMILANPVVGTLIAILGFHERLPTDPARMALIGLAALPLIAGLIVLPRSPLFRDTPEPGIPDSAAGPGGAPDSEPASSPTSVEVTADSTLTIRQDFEIERQSAAP